MLLVRRAFIRARSQAPSLWGALEQLIRLLNAANIPICGGAFGLASEVIDMINRVRETETECSVLLDLAARYARTMLDFVDAMQPDYIRASQDLPALLARKGIEAFQSDLARIVPIIKALSRKTLIQRALLRQVMADDIRECEQQLKRSHEEFKDIVMNTVVATMQRLALQSLADNENDDEVDPLRIVGAAVVKHHELKDPRPVVHLNDASGFWTDVIEAEVSHKRSLVKMYHERTGGEKAFLRDIERLGNCIFGLPRVRAYCLKSSTPFIVLEAESTRPLKNHLLELVTNVTLDVADRKVWQTMSDVNTAANFVSVHCQGTGMSSLSDALERARVDQNGQIVLAPQWPNNPSRQAEGACGATELTREILKNLLMGDHHFHQLSCISFTFGAASWKYMTREDVLTLSDAASAEAHLSANAVSSLCDNGMGGCTNESYEAWTQCSCLNHHVARPSRERYVPPKQSGFVNQGKRHIECLYGSIRSTYTILTALRIRLSSQVREAVSNLVGGLGFETAPITRQDQKLDTLPPKVWALLLIADGSFGEGSGSGAAPLTLLSPTEQTDLLGFLDRFEWDFDPALPQGSRDFP